MEPDDTPVKTPRTLRVILAAAPTRTLAAAGLLGLMWGPILATVLDVANGGQSEQHADVKADTLDPMPLTRMDPNADQPRSATRSTDGGPINLAVAFESSGPDSDVDPVDRLRSMTRFGELSK